MFNLNRSDLTDSQITEIVISNCIFLYKKNQKTLLKIVKAKQWKQKNYRSKNIISDEGLFCFTFLIITNTYLNLSKNKNREAIIREVTHGFFLGPLVNQNLESYKLAENLSITHQNIIAEQLSRYKQNLVFNEALINTFIKIVLGKKNNITRVQIHRWLKSLLEECNFFCTFHINTYKI